MPQDLKNQAKKLTLDSAAVIAHIQMLQGIINRMGSNSANCKYMAIAAVAAMMTLGTDTGWSMFLLCTLLTLILFLIDSMYLGQEKDFIRQQNIFLDRVKDNKGKVEDLYKIESMNGRKVQILLNGMKSWSTGSFYFFLWFSCLIYSLILNSECIKKICDCIYSV